MDKKLNFFTVATMYIGVIMGAGFASGRECWQFFGIFGDNGYKGILITGIGFLVVSVMISYIAISTHTIQLGALISPVESKLIYKLIENILAIIYYTMLIAMASAGGSLLNQILGLPQWIGGAIITALTLHTVLGSFSRMSSIFKKFVPVLFSICILAIIIVLLTQNKVSESNLLINHNSSISWQRSSMLFLSYNCMGMMTVAGSCAVSARSTKHAIGGAILGVILLTVITLMLLTVLLINPRFSSNLSLPMVGWSEAINTKFGLLYAFVLMGAIYQTATSTYYGFSITINNAPMKKTILSIGAIVAFIAGLTDFKKIVAILYPTQGYIGCIILILVAVNFIKIIINKIIKNIKKLFFLGFSSTSLLAAETKSSFDKSILLV